MGLQFVRRISVAVWVVLVAAAGIVPLVLVAQNAPRGAIQTPGGGRGPGAAPDATDPANASADLSAKPPVLAATSDREGRHNPR